MAFAIDVDIAGIKALRGQLNKLGNKKQLTEALRGRLVDAWISGVNQFIRVAVQRVKVDTGMTAATFLALSRAIKRNDAEALIETVIACLQRFILARSLRSLRSVGMTRRDRGSSFVPFFHSDRWPVQLLINRGGQFDERAASGSGWMRAPGGMTSLDASNGSWKEMSLAQASFRKSPF